MRARARSPVETRRAVEPTLQNPHDGGTCLAVPSALPGRSRLFTGIGLIVTDIY